MKTQWLTESEKARFGADVVFLVTYRDIVAVSPSVTETVAIPLFTAPAGFKVSVVATKLVNGVGFAQVTGASTSITATVGDVGDPDRLMAAVEILEAATPPKYTGSPALSTAPFAYSSDTVINLTILASGDDPDDLSTLGSGALLLYLAAEDLNQLPAPVA